MQENFFLDESSFFDKREKKKLIDTQIRFLNIAKRKQIPIFALEYKGRGETIPELQGILKDSGNYFIQKDRPNGFHNNPTLISLLERWKIKNLILTGVYSNVCIRETAEGAKKEGFNVFTSQELMDKSYDCYTRWYKENTDYSQKLDELLVKISNPNL